MTKLAKLMGDKLRWGIKVVIFTSCYSRWKQGQTSLFYLLLSDTWPMLAYSCFARNRSYSCTGGFRFFCPRGVLAPLFLQDFFRPYLIDFDWLIAHNVFCSLSQCIIFLCTFPMLWKNVFPIHLMTSPCSSK